MLSHRERVVRALNHGEPDRVPIDFGSTYVSTIHLDGYEALKAHLGIQAENVLANKMEQVVTVDERILELLDIDTRGAYLGAPDRSRDAQLTPTRWRDEWGVIRAKPEGSRYYDMVESPLSGEITVQDVLAYPWPDPEDAGRTRGLAEKVERLRLAGDHAIVLNLPGCFMHICQFLRGFNDWFTDLLLDPNLATALMDAVLEINMAVMRAALNEVGDRVDVVLTGDDLGLQRGPLVAPHLYRRLMKPRHRRALDLVRSLTPAKVLFHSCGDVYPFIGDLIEIGVDALNPVQLTATEMDPVRLKREFGRDISFWGGVDSQGILPNGSTDDVRREVAQRLRELGPGGGFVFNTVHNILPEVPVENVLAVFQTARELGRYPL